MPDFLRKPNLFCWGLALLCALIALLYHDRTLDIHLLDTYLIVNELFVLQVCVLFCLTGVLIYSLLLRFGLRPEPMLTVLHLALTGVGCVFLLAWPDPGHAVYRSFADTTASTGNLANQIRWYFLLMMTPAIGLALLVLNGLVALIFRK